MASRTRAAKLVRSAFLVVTSVFFIGTLFRLADAGSLMPVAPPSSTMNSLEEIYAPLVGTFDSTLVVQDDNGNALEISKCIIDVVNGGPGCP